MAGKYLKYLKQIDLYVSFWKDLINEKKIQKK